MADIVTGFDQRLPDREEPGANGRILLYPLVALPQVLAVALGLVLFVIGLAGGLGPI